MIDCDERSRVRHRTLHFELPDSTGSPTRAGSRGCRRTSPGSAPCSTASSRTSAPTPSCGPHRGRDPRPGLRLRPARVPITIRGSGTGNYGQTKPLAGGVVLDMTGYNALQWVRPGVARAQAGIRLGELEKHTRPSGQELRCIPSTYRSATLGGLFGGGFGGVGSINYGPLGAPGNVLGLRAMTIEPEPEIVELRGAEALRMHHLWAQRPGAGIEVALAPAHPWLESLVVFDAFAPALAFADALAHAPGIVKREVAFFASPVPDHLAQLAEHLPKGCHAVLSLVAESSEGPMRARRRGARRPNDLPQDCRGGAQEQPHLDGVHLEPHDAARAQGRQIADLSAEQLRAGPARGPDHPAWSSCSPARC